MHYISFRLGKKETESMSTFLDKIGFDKKKDELWVMKLDKHLKVYLLNNKLPLLLDKDGFIFPTILAAKLFEENYSEAIVDSGAVPHILNGADLMAPGIKNISLKNSNEILLIKDEDGTILAIGKLVKDFGEALDKKHGKVAENLHYLNDKLHKILVSKRDPR